MSDEEIITNDQLMDVAKELHEKLKYEIDDRGMDSSLYDWIIPTYESFKNPHPDDFEPLAQGIRDVTIAFTSKTENSDDIAFGDTDLEYLDAAARHMTQWDGDFSEAIKDNYLTPFPRITDHHGNVGMYLLDRIITMGHIYARRRKDAHKIAKDGLAAIESWNDSSGGSSLAIAMAFVISIGTIFTGIGGVVAGAAATAATTIGSGAIIGGTLGGALGSEEEEVPLGADVIQDIAKNIKSAIDKSEDKMHKDEDKVLECLQKAESELYRLIGDKDNRKHPMRPLTPGPGNENGTVKDGDLVIYA